MIRLLLLLSVVLCLGEPAYSHAPVTPVPDGPLRVRGTQLVDAIGQIIPLRGVVMPGLEAAAPTDVDLQTIAAMNTLTFRVLRQRWNMNAVRLAVGSPLAQRDGQRYLNRVAEIVKMANQADLIVVLAAVENRRAGAPVDTGLPSPDLVAFWQTWASFFRDHPRVIFDVYHQPSAQNIPGSSANQRRPEDWRFWLRGGVAANGRQVAGMQDLVQAIRSTGATQPIAVPAFHDGLGFQGLSSEFYIPDSNVLYEFRPYFDLALTNAERDASFGFLSSRFPVYAGEWGVTLLEDQPSCRRFPRDLPEATDTLFRTLLYFEERGISWTAFAFQPGRLIVDVATYASTTLDRPWTCGQPSNPPLGMGEFVLLWLTGDPTGFGALSPDQIANAAGGPSGPVAPGEIVSIYGFRIGPDPPVMGFLDSSGLLSTTVGETRVLFDGVPAPVFSAGAFQIVAQVPYSVAGAASTTVQAFFQDVPSNTIKVAVVDAAPGIFTRFPSRQILAVSSDGSLNSFGNPAAPGSILVMYATGAGLTSPPSVTGRPAQEPYPQPLLRPSLRIDGLEADILFAGEAPGFVGLLQINARVPVPPFPPPAPASREVPVVLTIGDRSNRFPGTIWLQ